MTLALQAIEALEEQLLARGVELPPRPTVLGTAYGKHDGRRKRRSAEGKFLRALRRLSVEARLASPPARAPRGTTQSGFRRQEFRAAEARAAGELEEAVKEAVKTGCVERREVDPSDSRIARVVDASPHSTERCRGSANGGVLYADRFTPFHVSGRKSSKAGTGVHTLHTEDTLRGAYRLRPNYEAGNLHAIALTVKDTTKRLDLEAVTVRVVFERVAERGGGRAMCRSAHLILEIRGLVVEVETSHPAFSCCVLADYDTIMHSTPHIPRELTKDGTRLLESTVPVLKLVCYTQAGLSSVLRTDRYAHAIGYRNPVLEAKATELKAVDALLPSTAASPAECACTIRDNYAKAARRTSVDFGPTTTVDDTSDTVYKPDGWAVRGQGERKAKRCKAVVLPEGETRSPMYLRACTFDKVKEEVWSETAEMAAAQGVLLGGAAAALAQTFPDALMAGFQAGGGHRWEGRFTYPTVALQAAGRAEAQSTPLWMRALHATQVGTRWAGPLPGASSREKEQFQPTARHLDKGDVKAGDLLKGMAGGGAKAARCGVGQAIILYVPCPPAAAPAATRSGKKRALGEA